MPRLLKADLQHNLSLITNASESRGGVRYQALTRDHATPAHRKLVDNKEVVGEMQKLIKKINDRCRSSCAKTDAGWITPVLGVSALRADFQEFKAQGDRLNQLAVRQRSAQRIRVAMVASTLQVDDTVLDLIHHPIVTIVEDLMAALKVGSVHGDSDYRTAMNRTRNLIDLFNYTDYRTSYMEVIKVADDARAQIMEAVRKGHQLEDAVRFLRPHFAVMTNFCTEG